MASRFAHCVVNDIRRAVQRRLRLPGPKGVDDPPAEEFWARAERQGRLVEAVVLYDRIAADWAEEARVPRETKGRFWQRVEREGRRAEAERVRAELLASGLTQREAQEELVERFQPLDGGRARAWPTPDCWEAGRLFLRWADQRKLLEEVSYEDEGEGEGEMSEAEGRVAWARFRREERLALAAARRRARELQAATPATVAGAPVS